MNVFKKLPFFFIIITAVQGETKVLTISSGHEFLKIWHLDIVNNTTISDEFPSDFKDQIGDLESSNYWYFHNQGFYFLSTIGINVTGASFVDFTMKYFIINADIYPLFCDSKAIENYNSTTGVLDVFKQKCEVNDENQGEYLYLDFSIVTRGDNIFILDEIIISSDGPYFPVPQKNAAENAIIPNIEKMAMAHDIPLPVVDVDTPETIDEVIETSFATTNPADGEQCPRNCKQTGWCTSFKRCVKDTPGNEEWRWDSETEWYVGVWEEFDCPGDLYWNPDNDSGPNGSCDKFGNLTPERRKQYKMDVKCWEPCYWAEHEEVAERCLGKYWYANRKDESQRLLQPPRLMQCPNGLIFNKALETCTLCKDIPGNTKNECCPEK